MALDAAEIERIVRLVIARLQSETAATPVAETTGIVLESKVVSLAQLDGRLGGARRIRVRRDAVITPAARDWLREREISVERVAVNGQPASSQRLVVGVADTPFDPTAVLRATGLGNFEQLARTGLTSVVDELCDHVAKSGSLGLLLTGTPAAALCLANRLRGVRAIAARDARSLSEGMSAVGANLLVLNPVGVGTLAIRRMVEQFCSEKRSCPEGLRKQLG